MTETPNDERLTRYLLGSLPAEEAERLDELSVTDDDFAARLSAAENDLVDAFVSGQLSGDTAAQFKANYLSSPKRREKVRFAKSFFSFQQNRIDSIAASSDISLTGNLESRWRFFQMPWLVPQWGLATAALLLLVASGYLVTANMQLRQRIDRSEADRASLSQREQDLQHQLATRTPASPETPDSAKAAFDKLHVAVFVLAPSLRDASRPPEVSVSPDTDFVVLKLLLESNAFSLYRAAITDSATRHVIWTSTDLKPFADGAKHAVSFAFRSNLLRQQNYIVQLTGIHAGGAAELVGSYPIRGVVK